MSAVPQNARRLSVRTATSAVWVGSARVIARAADFIIIIVLARFLTPADFGLVTLAASFVAVLEAITALPVGIPLVRLERCEKSHFDTAFTINLLRGAIIFALALVCAVAAVEIYGDERLFAVTLVLSLMAVFRSSFSPRLALLHKNLLFRQSFVMESLGKLVGLVAAIGLAVTTQSYWAIVAGTVSAAAVACIVSYIYAPYRPGVSFRHFRYFFNFLGWVSLAQLISAFSWQFDRFFLGAVAPKATVGLFGVANTISMLVPQSITKSIAHPFIASFVMMANDAERLRKAYHKAESAIVITVFPAMLGLALLADPLVAIVFGERWQDMAPILAALALALIPSIVRIPFRPLAMALGKTKLVFLTALAGAALRFPLIALGYVLGDVIGLIVGIGIANVGLSALLMVYVKRLIGLSVAAQIAFLSRPALSGLAMVAVFLVLQPVLEGRDGLSLVLAAGIVGSAMGAAYSISNALLWWLGGRPDGVERFVFDQLRALRSPRGAP